MRLFSDLQLFVLKIQHSGTGKKTLQTSDKTAVWLKKRIYFEQNNLYTIIFNNNKSSNNKKEQEEKP